MACISDFEWNDWTEFFNEDFDDTSGDQANCLVIQGATGAGKKVIDGSRLNDPWYQPIDTFSEPPLEYPYYGHPYSGQEEILTTYMPSDGTFRCFPPAPTGLPADGFPGSTAPLGDPDLLNPVQGIDQVDSCSGSIQPNDLNDMNEALLFGEAHVNTEARSTTSSALRFVSVGKPDEADDKVTVVDIDRLSANNRGRDCACLNCLDYPYHRSLGRFSTQFPALQQISCRVEGCTWNRDIFKYGIVKAFWETMFHEGDHFREQTRDQNGKLIYSCTHDRCRVRTKRRDDVRRHYATVHCKNPQRFPCHVISCPFGGENGFTRKDKLTSHMKSTHKGLPVPAKRLQAIKPKTGVSNAGVHKAGSQA